MEDMRRSKFSRTQQIKPPKEYKSKSKFGAGGFDNIQIFESKHKQGKPESEDDEDSLIVKKESSRKNDKVQRTEEDESDMIIWPTRQNKVRENFNQELVDHDNSDLNEKN